MIPRIPAGRPIALVAATLLCAAAPARADSFLDSVPPEPTVAKWVAGEPGPSLKALKGRCMLLELLDPDDLVSDGMVSRTAEIAGRADPKELVVVSVAVGTGAHEGTARGFADRRKITWSFGIDREGATLAALGAPAVPCYLLLAPDGRTVWEGSSGDLDDATLATHLTRARLWRPAEVTKVMRPAAAAYAAGRYSEAVKLAKTAMEGVEKRTRNDLPVEGGEEKDLALIEDAVKSTAEARFVLVARLERDRDSLDCLEMLEAIETRFKGTPWEEKAKEQRIELMVSDKHRKEIEQGRRLRDILAKGRPPTRRNLEKVLVDLDRFIEANVNMRVLERAVPERDRIDAILNPKKDGK